MEAKIRKGLIVISMPLEAPKLSATGKTLVVASSRGKRQTTVRVEGKFVYVIANAFILPDEPPAQKTGKRKGRPGK
jgi:hypothetical protein